MRRTATAGRRAGFTLVEMIIVIGIIALLAGLLLQVVVKVREAGQRAFVRNEIGQMEIGVENFKHTYDVKYVPSALILCSDYAAAAQQYGPTWVPALNDSQQYLSRVWPKANFKNAPSPPAVPDPFPPGTIITLDGNQVLVFLLGGVPPTDGKFTGGGWQGNRSGFLNSPVNPFNRTPFNPAGNLCMPPPTGAEAKGPFFDFKVDRIDDNGHYLDPYKWPYYYFSSRNGNDYGFFGTYYPALNPQNNPLGFTPQGGYGGIPVGTSLPAGGTAPGDIPPMNPFVGLDGKFINPNGFQIISAGKDNLPGPGGWDSINNVQLRYDPGTGEYSPGARGGNDVANFARGQLGGNE